MVERKRRMPFGDQEVEATEVGFRSLGEHWNEYLVDDGSVVRIKLVVTDIFRIDGTYDSEGNPIYLVKSTNVTAISSPESLRSDGS
jgi:hypothetical protein